MEIKTHVVNEIRIAEVVSDAIVINNIEDGKDLMGNLYYQDFDRIIIYESQLSPEFFDLKNGMAGEILQKFSTYRVRLVIVGNFAGYSSKSLRDFIYESNNGKQINFLSSLNEAINRLSSR